MANSSFTIRAARPADAPQVLTLVKALADYEKLVHEVTATAADMERLLGEGTTMEALLAYAGDEAVGLAVFYETYSTFTGKPGIFLEDIFIQPNHRRKGYGLALFRAVAAVAQRRGCARLEWEALDWNTPAHDFYESLGAQKLSQWLPFRLDEAGIATLAASVDR